MPRKIPHLAWLVLPLAFFLYFYHLNAAGLVGPDEPRYASVGREMARSGDFVTPRLWGQPWFEKPALLYWMTAAGFRLGLGPELAPRLPVAFMAVMFLGFYWWILRREFGSRAAALATLILGTSAGWVGFSQVGVTDLPLSATFSAAMLLALPWIARGDSRPLPAVAALLGLAVLAKGLVPLVLALPLLMRGRIRDLVRWRVVLPFLVVALPWYVLCYLRNGAGFLDVFFRQQTFARFYSTALQHPQAWWFYLPVLLAGLLPWTPLVALAGWRSDWRDPRRAFLLAWVLFGLVFFSAAANKLPGYVLPLLPAAAVLMGIGLEKAARPRLWLAACALLLVLYPIAARVLPAAVAVGLSRAPRAQVEWTWLLPVASAAAVWALARKGNRVAAAGGLAVCATAGVIYLKSAALPELNRAASARALWSEIGGRAGEVCVDEIQRDWRYGLNYYSVAPLPDCGQEPRPLAVRQASGEVPRLMPAALVAISPGNQ
jgi:4-amino-4-deoxy-L-arabinose transferase-like glycosyltransferase